jgi:diguanylate cyclase (GGDEF)-like protein
VGEAFASGLDRQGIVELAVATAVDACDAETGRAVPTDRDAFEQTDTGADDAALDLLQPLDPATLRPKQRSAVAGSADGAHALAVPMRARLGSQTAAQYVGVVSIARRGNGFSRQDSELLEYLAGQAVVSIENAALHETIQRQAVTDELTGLANNRELHATLDREIERSRRFRSPLGLVMLDIDNFKGVNDRYGHQQGDEVLAGVASVLRELSRDIDEPARYGGEELAVVLPQTDSEGAALLAERMREAIERMRVPRVGGDGFLTVTASFGVAAIPDSADDKRGLIRAADAALYVAKRSGKNRVERADPVPAPR